MMLFSCPVGILVLVFLGVSQCLPKENHDNGQDPQNPAILNNNPSLRVNGDILQQQNILQHQDAAAQFNQGQVQNINNQQLNPVASQLGNQAASNLHAAQPLGHHDSNAHAMQPENHPNPINPNPNLQAVNSRNQPVANVHAMQPNAQNIHQFQQSQNLGPGLQNPDQEKFVPGGQHVLNSDMIHQNQPAQNMHIMHQPQVLDELPQPGENVAYNNQHLPPQEIDPNQGLMHLNQGVGDQDKPQQVMGLPPKHPFGQQIPAGQGFPPNPYNQGLEQQRARIQAPVQDRNKKLSDTLLSHHPACIHDIQGICDSKSYNLANNVDVIECLSLEENVDDVSKECHHLVWSYKRNMTMDSKLRAVVEGLCGSFTQAIPQCNKMEGGKYIACLMEHRVSISDPGCVDFLTKIEVIIFSDFHMIDGFIEECNKDIERYNCGKINPKPADEAADESLHSQEEVVICLEEHLEENENALTPECDQQITRLAELSADDFHLDRHIYVNCKHDREVFCAEVVAGEGRIYKCLFDNKFHPKMSVPCREALTGRQQLIGKDYKASYALAHKCKEDIQNNGCDLPIPQGGHLAVDHHHVHLATILLCLENSEAPPSPYCEQEMISYRKMLLSDYQITPEITAGCSQEITQKCKNGLEKDGRTLHCLFGLAQEEAGLGPQCTEALEALIKESEVVKDYRMDPVLLDDCEHSIERKCSDFNEGDPMILGCLLEHLNDHDFDRRCRKTMIELQYFISRDFTIDPEFRDVCLADAKRICKTDQLAEPIHESQVGGADNFQLPLSMVISCLYRNIMPSERNIESPYFMFFHHNYSPKQAIEKSRDQRKVKNNNPVSEECAEKVHEAIRQRAMDVNLNPDLDMACRHDLGEYCSQTPHQQGTEFRCLQDNYENLSSDCRDVVQTLTQNEGENVLDFDDILVQECKAMLDQYCSDLLNSNDEGLIMQCLIDNKGSMESKKCAAGITHFQLIEAKDFHLNFNFLKHCTNDVKRFCAAIKGSQYEIIKCLSKQKRDHVISDGASQSLSPECDAEVTLEKLQMHENILLNSNLNEKCKHMYREHCNHVQTGEAEVIECLREHKDLLDTQCYKALFEFEEEESLDPKLDYKLMHGCKETINNLCWEEMQEDEEDYVFECLLRNKHNIKNKNCEHIVIEREKEMFSDISLNPELNNACEKDINLHCAEAKLEALQDHKEGKDPHGIIYECLKDSYAVEELSPPCHLHLELVIREQQNNYRLDPQLVLKCTDTIEKLCHPKEEKNVVECLKKHYFASELQEEQECLLEVAKLLREGHTDIKADPILEETCMHDLKQHCNDVPEGHGRLIKCLVMVADDPNRSLTAQCTEEIASRRAMWKQAASKHLKGFMDLHAAVQESEHSSYIVSVLTLSIFAILIAGVFCGRISRKITRLRNKRRLL